MKNTYIRVAIPPSASGQLLSAYLASAGYPLNAACGSNGRCGKCTVCVTKGYFCSSPNGEKIELGADGKLRACRAYCTDTECEILLPITAQQIQNERDEEISTVLEHLGSGYSMALDIGTTTLAAALVDDASGKIVRTLSRLNPQQSFGADVMSRIQAAGEGHLDAMHSLLLASIRDMITEWNVPMLNRLVVVGNTTMLHIFCNISPVSMGQYPFTPAFTSCKQLDGERFRLPVHEIVLLPCASAFIGADIVAGAFNMQLTDEPEPVLLMDIGTNGEMMLFTGKNRGGELYTTSTAAGPALEGAGISTGVGGVSGAVCAVEPDKNSVKIHTIGGQPPIGICGSGLTDLIAYLLECKQLDETGYLENEEFVYATYGEQTLSLTQEDVRAFQLAKAAIRAGVETLLCHAGLLAKDLSKVYLAGGLGFYTNVNSAATVGLIPCEIVSKVSAVGNSALGGAAKSLQCHMEEITKLTQMCKSVDLHSSDVFRDSFIEYMMLEKN